MAESDALSKFDFNKVTKPSIFLRFEPGVPVKVRILTVDPVVSTTTFEDKKTGDEVVNTRFAFIASLRLTVLVGSTFSTVFLAAVFLVGAFLAGIPPPRMASDPPSSSNRRIMISSI